MIKGEFIFGSWSKEKRKFINIMNLLAIIFCIIALSSSIVAIFFSGSLFYHTFPVVIGGVFMAVMSLFFVYVSRSAEFRIYENCIMFPKILGRKIIPYSEISEIKLNTDQQQFIPEIEINLKNGTTLKYPKDYIEDLGVFYKIMIKEVSGKVKVVE